LILQYTWKQNAVSLVKETTNLVMPLAVTFSCEINKYYNRFQNML